eukprot:TRINITY_DN67733_c6_g1_i1.p1 TRINITY_DN67733_c6_g1~~TRINITY_DN67733_c6_g1_i1.p1  ORF type:complete len:160 (+),score=16.51 TRINITY_DN67733_c6_g1_i1:26-505(+)
MLLAWLLLSLLCASDAAEGDATDKKQCACLFQRWKSDEKNAPGCSGVPTVMANGPVLIGCKGSPVSDRSILIDEKCTEVRLYSGPGCKGDYLGIPTDTKCTKELPDQPRVESELEKLFAEEGVSLKISCHVLGTGQATLTTPSVFMLLAAVLLMFCSAV